MNTCFACCCSRARAGRCVLGTHTVSVFASQRLRCDAHAGVAPQNSLRALCALRSDSCGEHVDEARCACLPRPCASRRHRGRPQRTAPSASLYKMRCVKLGEPMTLLRSSALTVGAPPALQPRRIGPCAGAPLGRRVAQGLRPRAQRALLTDSSQLSERSAQSARSEFCDGPHERATQGSRSAAKTAPVKRLRRGLYALAASSNENANEKQPT